MRRPILIVFLGILATTFAWSQTAETGVTVGWSAFTDSTIGRLGGQSGAALDEFSLNNGIRIGSRLAINSWEFLGHELSYAYQRSPYTVGSSWATS